MAVLILTKNYLAEKGFVRVQNRTTFIGVPKPHYVKNNVVLFYDTPVPVKNIPTLYASVTETRGLRTYVVICRSIRYQHELEDFYKGITGKEL